MTNSVENSRKFLESARNTKRKVKVVARFDTKGPYSVVFVGQEVAIFNDEEGKEVCMILSYIETLELCPVEQWHNRWIDETGTYCLSSKGHPNKKMAIAAQTKAPRFPWLEPINVALNA